MIKNSRSIFAACYALFALSLASAQTDVQTKVLVLNKSASFNDNVAVRALDSLLHAKAAEWNLSVTSDSSAGNFTLS